MFFFGLFSTQIPYIVLAVLYLVGFGAYSVNSIKNKNSIEIPAEKVLDYVAKSSINKSAKKDFYYSSFTERKASKTVSKNFYSCNIIIYIELSKHNYVPDQIVFYSIQTSFSLYSRPPPVV